MTRVIIRPTNRLQWVRQGPPPYVRERIEKCGGWVIDHENCKINPDPEYVDNGRKLRPIADVLNELDKLEPFPANCAYWGGPHP